MKDRSNTYCVLCQAPAMDGQPYVVVYAGEQGDNRLAHADSRIGLLHTHHLSNVFNPDMIDVEHREMQGLGPSVVQTRVQVRL